MGNPARPLDAAGYYALATRLPPEAAVAALRLSLAITPGFPQGAFALGNALSQLDRRTEAAAAYRRALALRPDYAEAQHNLGNALPPRSAVLPLQIAALLRPNHGKAYNSLGTALAQLEQGDAALRHFRRAVQVDPRDALAWHNLGIALIEEGDIDAGRAAHGTAVALAPKRARFYRLLADAGGLHPGSTAARGLQDLAAGLDQLTSGEQIDLHFALGRVCHDRGDRVAAMRHWRAGNRLHRSLIAYDEGAVLGVGDAIMEIFSADFIARQRETGQGESVIFIVGMPRSGTSLLEQLLASHSAIHGGGERQDLKRLVTAAGRFPQAVAGFRPADFSALGAEYLESQQRSAAGRPWFIDKMPGNFNFIGVIHLALPRARILHIRRDAIDVCLSCFAARFAGQQPFAYDLAELGRYYRSYERLMAHWRQVLPAGIMTEIAHEDLVRDPEAQIRPILAACGLAWDPAILSFYRTRRPVRTASAGQVREAMDLAAIGRWQGYRALVPDLIDALGAGEVP